MGCCEAPTDEPGRRCERIRGTVRGFAVRTAACLVEALLGIWVAVMPRWELCSLVHRKR